MKSKEIEFGVAFDSSVAWTNWRRGGGGERVIPGCVVRSCLWWRNSKDFDPEFALWCTEACLLRGVVWLGVLTRYVPLLLVPIVGTNLTLTLESVYWLCRLISRVRMSYIKQRPLPGFSKWSRIRLCFFHFSCIFYIDHRIGWMDRLMCSIRRVVSIIFFSWNRSYLSHEINHIYLMKSIIFISWNRSYLSQRLLKTLIDSPHVSLVLCTTSWLLLLSIIPHGSLLDAIRETKVVAGEAGGITQHVSAYQVQSRWGIDEAFPALPCES